MAIKIGTINRSKEIKMPDGTWRYVGNRGTDHPVAKQLIVDGYEVQDCLLKISVVKEKIEKKETLDLRDGHLLECVDSSVYRLRQVNGCSVVEMLIPSKNA